MTDIRSVVEWLMDGARSASRAEDVLRELCHRMIAAGIPLWRAAVFVNRRTSSINSCGRL